MQVYLLLETLSMNQNMSIVHRVYRKYISYYKKQNYDYKTKLLKYTITKWMHNYLLSLIMIINKFNFGWSYCYRKSTNTCLFSVFK